jgi:SAM-dependent methyltransferase
MRRLPVPDQWLGYSVTRRLLDRDLDKLRPRMRGRVLEIGGGQGQRRGCFRPPLEQAESWHYLDIDPKRRPDVLADAHSLPFPAGAFDTVMCLEVLEYVNNPMTCLQECARVLREGGTLILAAPFIHQQDQDNDRWRWTEKGLLELLHEAGLIVETSLAQGGALSVLAAILFRVLYLLRPSAKRNLLAALAKPLLFRLLAWDDGFCARNPGLAAYSIGYLMLARKPSP